MLIPISDDIWINPRNITKIIQDGKSVLIYLIGDVQHIILNDSSADEVAKFLNSPSY
jgi:hypothetical protein